MVDHANRVWKLTDTMHYREFPGKFISRSVHAAQSIVQIVVSIIIENADISFA